MPLAGNRLARRRSLLVGAIAAVVACACGRPTVRATPTSAVARPPEFDTWSTEAQAMVSDAFATLQTFDDFQAFRVSTAEQSSSRLPSEVPWDPPTGAAWDEATHVTRGLHGRADQLFKAVTTATLDPSVWRDQRKLADATHDLLDLSDALGAYRDRIDALRPGDATGALGLLDAAWARWETAAGRWGISRSESIPCASR